MLLTRTSDPELPQTLKNRPLGWLPMVDGNLANIVIGGLPQVLGTHIIGGRAMKE
ncbi:hypothetical protein PCC7424_5633 (plasmid) [Gloeothece citriformis PCC 7424]|uniref:Uncharacterized protein n=1 Tax=Gloeothece citriformis (strain PCC 7424) TaxID=65393 RepID=B7KLN7_GLOC7|nr:hypothetical protein [Gloeothece citriformis]ACK73709.1 hypothetical protein PCC7424_5633 [Gloeothece citriformis PCC 7424]